MDAKRELLYKKITEYLTISQRREAIICVTYRYRNERNLEEGCLYYFYYWTIIQSIFFYYFFFFFTHVVKESNPTNVMTTLLLG